MYILFLQNVNLHESEKQETPPLAVTEESKIKATQPFKNYFKQLFVALLPEKMMSAGDVKKGTRNIDNKYFFYETFTFFYFGIVAVVQHNGL